MIARSSEIFPSICVTRIRTLISWQKGALPSNTVFRRCSGAKRKLCLFFYGTSSTGRQVTALLEKLQAEIESDGKAEAESYDKYAAPRLPRAQRPKLKLSHKV